MIIKRACNLIDFLVFLILARASSAIRELELKNLKNKLEKDPLCSKIIQRISPHASNKDITLE